MHFVRFVEGDRADVRCRSYYVYKCSICGEEKTFWWVPNFDTSRLRKCPTCKVEDDTNNKEYLINQKHSLEQSIQDMLQQIQIKRNELEQVSAKLSTLQLESKQPQTPIEVM